MAAALNVDSGLPFRVQLHMLDDVAVDVELEYHIGLKMSIAIDQGELAVDGGASILFTDGHERDSRINDTASRGVVVDVPSGQSLFVIAVQIPLHDGNRRHFHVVNNFLQVLTLST